MFYKICVFNLLIIKFPKAWATTYIKKVNFLPFMHEHIYNEQDNQIKTN